MQAIANCLVVLAISALLSAGTNSSGQVEYAPSVNATTVRQRYLDSVDSIRKVDFASLHYYIGDGTSGFLFRLRNGKFKIKFNIGGDEISLDHVYYFRPNEADPEAALVEITHLYWGGSSSQDGVLLLFRVDDAGLIVTQQLVYDQQAERTGTEFNSATDILTVRARSNDNSPHCCAKSIDIVTLKWAGKGFEEQSHRTVPVKRR